MNYTGMFGTAMKWKGPHAPDIDSRQSDDSVAVRFRAGFLNNGTTPDWNGSNSLDTGFRQYH